MKVEICYTDEETREELCEVVEVENLESAEFYANDIHRITVL